MQILYYRAAVEEADPAWQEAGDTDLTMLGHTVVYDCLSSPPTRYLNDVDAVIINGDNNESIDVCREVRRWSNVPVILVARRFDDVDVVEGLAVGADDYLVRPASARVLDARLRAIERRARPVNNACTLSCRVHIDGGPDTHTIIFIEQSRTTIDPGTRQAMRAGRTIPLTAIEAALLTALAQRRGHPQSRDSLLGLAWGYDHLGQPRIVDNAVQRLRRKIDTPEWKHIRTVRGVGYLLR